MGDFAPQGPLTMSGVNFVVTTGHANDIQQMDARDSAKQSEMYRIPTQPTHTTKTCPAENVSSGEAQKSYPRAIVVEMDQRLSETSQPEATRSLI